LIIALTHMRMPNDTTLAESVNGIDIILGGHDHHYEVKKVHSYMCTIFSSMQYIAFMHTIL